ncbi:hypothetical protein HF086_004976 [Spodoptera exigua]|uniref:THAP-type domain-containing protein n=1 Tax=Spodoptera exigua TaxID=7107 RepID=A0A922S8F4_SPOEX|nr:hypothetical protein HF086_004976 [Spodoptera exigua]
MMQYRQSTLFFPKDSEKRQKWWSVIPLKGKFYESAKICSLHFKPENYDPLRPKRLLNSAVPVDSVQLCSCGNNVMACKTPFKCLVSPNAMIPTETDTCSSVRKRTQLLRKGHTHHTK